MTALFFNIMTLDEFKASIYNIEKPSHWREGQFVFNTIDRLYRVARTVQFNDKIDCFYDNSKIGQFINACYNRLYGN